MRISVAMRVIGGFVVISVLLIALGISSISSVNRIGSASTELSNVALPTVAGTSNLKANFLNLGRLTFESFVSQDLAEIKEKQSSFNSAQGNFNQTLLKLTEIVKNDSELSNSIAAIQSTYNDYERSANDMFSDHIRNIELQVKLQELTTEIEEKIDDASSLLLDFTYLEEIENSTNLQQASKLAEPMESGLLTLFTVIAEYKNTQILQRAELRVQEVEVLLQQANDRLSEINKVADGQDSSGTLDEISDLMKDINGLLTSTNGILPTKLNQIKSTLEAGVNLKKSDTSIELALSQLQKLNILGDKKAIEIKTSVNSQISNSTLIVITLIIGSLLLASGIAYVSVRAITVPLDRVNSFLKVASSGDLTHRLDESSKDEFGLLSKNCNLLIDSLKELIFSINQRADQLAAASVETSAVTMQTTKSIENQKSQISQVAAATTEMHTTSELVSNSADDTLQQIKHADEEAEKVKVISAENKSTIQVLAKDVEQAAEVINKLHQDSASIGGILDVIRGVADQTNLLALNAAIEAARAGEQGRGFAVVADEVRTLASRTQESTQEINAMIEVLQAGAEKAVAVMNQGREQTSICVEQTEHAGNALNLITDAVHKAYEVSTRIEQAAREQYTVSSQISERLENIVGIAEQTTIGAKQTSESSSEVARLAEELQESIGRFKV